MASYIFPGAYSQEIPSATGVNVTNASFTPCFIGTGSPNKTILNELVVRGAVNNEALTISGSSPWSANLSQRSNRRNSSTKIIQTLNGIASVVPQSYITFAAPTVTGTVSATVNLTTDLAIGIALDGLAPLTVVFHYAATTPTPVVQTTAATGTQGRQITVNYTFSGSGGAAATLAQIRDCLNAVLSSAPAVAAGYTGYVSPASLNVSNQLVVTGNTDVQILEPIAESGTVAIFGAAGAGNRLAPSTVIISNSVYNPAATYSTSYVSLTSTADPLLNTTGVQQLDTVGSSSNGSNYVINTDVKLNGATVDWTLPSAASIVGIAGTGAGNTFNLGTAVNIILDIDEATPFGVTSANIPVQLIGLANPPLNYDSGSYSTGTVVPAATIAQNINAVLAAQLGVKYSTVASVATVLGTPRVVLTSPSLGRNASSISVTAPSTLSGALLVFGQLYSPAVLGKGKAPAAGSSYYVTYDITRPASDYNVPFLNFSVDAVKAQVGGLSAATAGFNPLAIMAEIAWEQGVSSIYTIQINDTGSLGNPSRPAIDAALFGATTLAGCTEIVVLGTPGVRSDITLDVTAQIEAENAQTTKHPRRQWAGQASGTPIGDIDTVGSLCYIAGNVLQVGPTSPGRGRLFNVVGPSVNGLTRTVNLADGTTVTLTLDNTYLAGAVASLRSTLAPAETLTRKTVTQSFNTADIVTPWLPSQIGQLVQSGNLVVRLDAGNLRIVEAVSTENGGGGLQEFVVDSTSFQKDVVVQAVNKALDDNIVAVVPDDLVDFIIDFKLVIESVLASMVSNKVIGPFKDNNGVTRALDLNTDIKVVQDPNDATKYQFAYYFNLRYPALRLFGTYSVDKAWFNNN